MKSGAHTLPLADIFQNSFRIGLVSFTHCPREANRVAHNLAKSTYISKSVVFWGRDPPSCIMKNITDDVTIL